jgi:hypothetical protein
MSATLTSAQLAAAEMQSKSSYRRALTHDLESSTSESDRSVGFREELPTPKIAKSHAIQQVKAPTVTVKIQMPKAVAKPPVKPAPFTEVDMFAHVLSFLPLEDIEVARLAAPVLAEAAERVAPKPLPCDDVVFVRWEPQELHTAILAPKSHLPVRRAAAGASYPPHVNTAAVFPWRCLSCGTVTSGPRQCGTCRAPLATSACRVFLGQLRKDLSAELATAMVRSLLPDVTVLHMESHTNGADGRGKGCAWAYVNSVEDALRITSLHKRVFIDLDADHAEGFWYVKDAQLVGHLNAMADVLGQARGRPVWLPRQPLVAELPASSLLAQYVNAISAQH